MAGDLRDLREAAQRLLYAVSPIGGRCAVCVTAGGAHTTDCEWVALRDSLAGVAAGPQATPDPEPVCGGFVWIGQPMTSCDRCGQPAWEHEGLDQPPDDPFSDAPSTVRPWKPGEAEAIRSKWGCLVAVPTDHEDQT